MAPSRLKEPRAWFERDSELIILLAASAIFFGCIVSPPSLMDDVDSVHAQIARTMLNSGDWTTARLNGVVYLDKSPMIYWLIAAAYRLLGVHDWAARIPVALAAVLLCWLTTRFAAWAFGRRAGFHAGLCLATCVGLFLFTRVLIPDVMLTLTVALALWSFLRALEPDEPYPRRWAFLLAVSLGAGLLLKGLVGVVIPVGAAVLYLGVTRQLFSAYAWRRLHPFSGAVITLLIPAVWYVEATLQNPPYFDLTFHSAPGEYRGFFWRYFINEHVLRYLNLRHPRDYDTVPRLWFWLLHLVWLFPWSAYFPAALKLSYKPIDRAGRTRLLAVCWAGFVLAFFTFSTTQEYYSMPCYPALALLLGSALASGTWVRAGTKVLAAAATVAAAGLAVVYLQVRSLPTPGDISQALRQDPEAYRLSLGHLGDLTLRSLAYLQGPLLLALMACLVGGVGGWRLAGRRAVLAIALMMVLLAHAARMALVVFDPYLSSRPLAEMLLRMPEGQLIVGDQYYTFSSVFFYTGRQALLLNGRVNNLEYGSYAPGAPQVFIGDAEFRHRWSAPGRSYVVAHGPVVAHLQQLLGRQALIHVAESGGKFLFTNQPLPSSPAPASGTGAN